jgi:NAD(P)-dependent dehydrogenase (short-subunit alcohol dehydrogenase family)
MGRHDPEQEGLVYLPLDITDDANKVSADIDGTLKKTGPIDMFVYSAGFFEQGTLGEIDDEHIRKVINIGMMTPALFISKILKTQKQIDNVIFVTSTSQWIPRLKEPLYAATKAGLSMLGNSLSLDPQVGKTLVIGPSGMDTPFWQGGKRSGVLLDPVWVAQETYRLLKESFVYRLVRVTRDPPKVTIVEER